MQRVLYDVLWLQEERAVTLPHSAQRKHAFWGGIKQISKSKKLAPRKKVSLELFQYGLGHRSTRPLMAGDTVNFWRDVELRIDKDPFLHIMSNFFNEQKGRVLESTKANGPFKCGFMDIIPATAPESLTSETTFSNYLLIVDAYSKIPKLYGMYKITTE